MMDYSSKGISCCMATTKIRKIRVGDSNVGLVGLDAVLNDLVIIKPDASDQEICSEILRHLKKSNYIPPSCKGEYSESLLREYKRRKEMKSS